MGKLFGTDGIRGIANVYPITPEMVLRLGKAIAHYFRNKKGNGKTKIVIGKDTRLSGYMLESALTSGICSMGADVLLVGPMPTPAIAHLTQSLNADAGIVLSASHNPASDNGIKIFSRDGFKLADEAEKEIEKLVLSEEIKSDNVRGDMIGKAFRIDDARGRYIAFAKSTIKSNSLEGLKIVLDCANGAGYALASVIFRELGADVFAFNDKPDGLNINFQCGALFPEIIQKKVKEKKADIGIALDGDADRAIVCDEKGKLVDGDFILAICGNYLKEKGKLKQDTIVATVMSNVGFGMAMKDRHINVIKTKVGDRHVVEEMRKGKYNLGGEQSGHIVFLDYSTTGDGIITGLQLMNIMKKTGKKLSELAGIMKQFPQILLNLEVKEKKELEKMQNVMNKINEVEKKLGGQGRVLVRYSGTQNICRVMVEGQDEKEIEKMASDIINEIKKEIGR